MRFIADEHISRHLIEGLRADGHDVARAARDYSGFSDEQIAEIAQLENRVVLTEDSDYGELAVRHGVPIPGVILIALPGMTSPEIAKHVRQYVRDSPDDILGALVVIEHMNVRRRTLTPEA